MNNILDGFFGNAFILQMAGFFTSLFALLIPYIALIIMNSMIALQKNRNVLLTVLTSILLTPIIPYLYLLAVPPVNIEHTTINMKTETVAEKPNFTFRSVIKFIFIFAILIIVIKVFIIGNIGGGKSSTIMNIFQTYILNPINRIF
jgi:hypothetical protein